MSRGGAEDDTKGDVYVMGIFLNNRIYKEKPGVNAERRDADRFYEDGVYDSYPDMKKGYEARRRRERQKINKVNDWATLAVEALEERKPLPMTTRRVMPEVLAAVYQAAYYGITRPELCRILKRDGGKVSASLHDLHAAKIIFPLERVRR